MLKQMWQRVSGLLGPRGTAGGMTSSLGNGVEVFASPNYLKSLFTRDLVKLFDVKDNVPAVDPVAELHARQPRPVDPELEETRQRPARFQQIGGRMRFGAHDVHCACLTA